jgi:hypothetical protein
MTTNPWTHIIAEIWVDNHELACDVQRTATQLANPGVDPDPEIVYPSLHFTQQFRATGAQVHELK